MNNLRNGVKQDVWVDGADPRHAGGWGEFEEGDGGFGIGGDSGSESAGGGWRWRGRLRG